MQIFLFYYFKVVFFSWFFHSIVMYIFNENFSLIYRFPFKKLAIQLFFFYIAAWVKSTVSCLVELLYLPYRHIAPVRCDARYLGTASLSDNLPRAQSNLHEWISWKIGIYMFWRNYEREQRKSAGDDVFWYCNRPSVDAGKCRAWRPPLVSPIAKSCDLAMLSPPLLSPSLSLLPWDNNDFTGSKDDARSVPGGARSGWSIVTLSLLFCATFNA